MKKHTHEYMGQKLRHSHEYGKVSHGYFEHPEDGVDLRDRWIEARALYLQSRGPDEFPFGYYRSNAADEAEASEVSG
jgi:hypothetical protein